MRTPRRDGAALHGSGGAASDSMPITKRKKAGIFSEVLLTVFPHIIHNCDIGTGSMVSDHR
jgi:hypothetical protein